MTVEEILAVAGARTAEAAAGCGHVLIVEDTSELNYQAKAGRQRGLGTVGNGSDAGLFVHPQLAVNAEDGTVLGLAHAQIWRRLKGKAANYQSLPIEAKESWRWIAPAKTARERLAQTPLATVVADREADIYEAFARLPDPRTHVLIRATRDRALDDGGRLLAWLGAQPEAGRLSFELPARPRRTPRTVTLAVRFGAAAVRRPAKGADPSSPAAITLNVVEVQEIDPPSSSEAICWRLLTTHTVASLQDAARMVELYRMRWTIEQLFRTLKSRGLDLEDSLLGEGEALERLAAVGLVAAAKVMQLVHARGEPGRLMPAARVFAPAEIPVLHALNRRLQGRTAKQQNPHPPETLAWAAWAIARLGGWTGYATERPPGPITFANGLKRFAAIAEGFALASG